jgi:hypothetical protein
VWREAGAAREHLPRCGSGAGDRRSGEWADPRVDPEDDIRVEHRQQGVEVTRAGGSQEGVDDFALVCLVGVGCSCGTLDATPAPACELPRRVRGPADDGGDLLERHPEHVVEHERESLGRRERFEHDQ